MGVRPAAADGGSAGHGRDEAAVLPPAGSVSCPAGPARESCG